MLRRNAAYHAARYSIHVSAPPTLLRQECNVDAERWLPGRKRARRRPAGSFSFELDGRSAMSVSATAAVSAAAVTSTAMTSTAMTAARVTSAGHATGTTATGMTTRPAAGPSDRTVPWPLSRASNHMATAVTMPAVPTGAAAPTESAPPGIAAPIEAGPAPAVVVPAIIAAEIDELGLLDVGRHGALDGAVNRHRTGLSDRA